MVTSFLSGTYSINVLLIFGCSILAGVALTTKRRHGALFGDAGSQHGFHCLRLRKPAQHSQCDVCFKASQFIHCSKASFREKQAVAKQWREHLRSQYQDRVVYWCLRYQSKQPQSDVLSIIIDGWTNRNCVYPSYGFINGAPKLLDKFHRPRCCIHLNLCHGYSADFWVTEEEGMCMEGHL